MDVKDIVLFWLLADAGPNEPELDQELVDEIVTYYEEAFHEGYPGVFNKEVIVQLYDFLLYQKTAKELQQPEQNLPGNQPLSIKHQLDPERPGWCVCGVPDDIQAVPVNNSELADKVMAHWDAQPIGGQQENDD